jgi:hypothetical protein
LRQDIPDRGECGAGGVAVAEVDHQQQRNQAHVDLHEGATVILAACEPLGTPREALGDRLPGLAQASDWLLVSSTDIAKLY